jgi:SAM-dependent methyltransferase
MTAFVFSVGQAYEAFMGRWSRRLAAQFARFAGVADGEDVLDVGCGTGSLAAAVAAASPSSRVVAIDRSESYVAAARVQHEAPRVRFEVGDAQDLHFGNGSFDRTLALLILNFVPRPEMAVDEMRRVTRPGGTVAAAVWDYGNGMEMLRTFWDAAVSLVPEADDKDERHMEFSRRGELGALWRSRGLQRVFESSLTIDTPFASFDDLWTPFLAQQGPAGAYAARLSAHELERLRLELRRRLLGHDGPDGPIALRARARRRAAPLTAVWCGHQVVNATCCPMDVSEPAGRPRAPRCVSSNPPPRGQDNGS